MRKIVLSFVLCVIICPFAKAVQAYTDKTIAITLTVGVPYTIKPHSDLGIPTSYVEACYAPSKEKETSGSYDVSDNTAFSIVPTKNKYEKYYTNFYYYYYKLTPQKTGFYTFKQKIYYNNRKTGALDYDYGEPTITYNITVVDVVSVTIPNSFPIALGYSYTFSPQISHPKATTTLTWQSSNPSIATINAKGVLNAVGIGVATITCIAHNGVSASCVVTVDPVWTTGISLDHSSYSLQKNESLRLIATVIPADATYKGITWSSSDENIASVSQDGTVTGVSAGTCNIVASTSHDGRIYATCQITVTKENRLVAAEALLCRGGQESLAIQMTNDDVMAGMQFDIMLPGGISVVNKYLAERGENHTISSNKLPDADNIWRFVVLSTSGDNIIGNEGTLANITLQAADNMALGDYQLQITNTVLTKSDGTKLYPADVQGVIHIIEPTMGDVNNDGDVDIADAIAVVNHILKKEATVFVNTAADMNSDGIIDIGDAIAIVNVILKK